SRYLDSIRARIVVSSPVGGLVTLPRTKEKAASPAKENDPTAAATRLRERVGQFLREGDLICVIEDPGELEAEVSLEEQVAARVQVGHAVELKARALPFQS